MAELASDALTTVADVKESLGIASSDHSKDNLITRKINQVTALIQKATGRSFKLQQHTEYKDGSQTDAIVLQQRPIVQDDTHPFTVGRRETNLNEDDFEDIEANMSFIDNDAGIINLNYTAGGHWSQYKYTYWAGYATIPDDLAEAANALVCWYVQNPSGSNIGVGKRKEGQKETQYGGSSSTPTTFDSILQQLGIDGVIQSYSNQPLLTSN